MERRLAAGLVLLCLLLLAGVAVAGESAAVPGLGPHTWYPPWDLGRHPASGLVTAVLAVAYLAGSAGVGLGLRAIGRGATVPPRALAVAAVSAVLLLTAVPPLGSADHLSYAAYGRIAAAGSDPYQVDPLAWRGGTDPVAGAVQPPWQHTRSVYGPVATAAQAAVAWLGHGSLRLTVWLWQLLAGAAFLAAAFTLDRLTRADPAGRARVAVIWTLNPLLLGQLVLGGHLDVLPVAAALGAFALAARRPLLAGALLGSAVGCKITFALFGLAVLWGLRRAPSFWRSVGLGLLGALLVLVPAHLWSGPHTYDQLRQASRFVSLATPWRLLVDQLDPVVGPSLRTVLGPVALACGVALGVALFRPLRAAATTIIEDGASSPAARPGTPAVVTSSAGASAAGVAGVCAVTADIFRAAVLLGAAWVLTTPYALPWYDAMVWGPLAVLAASALDWALLARLAVLSLAYVPGRVVGMSAEVERLTLGFRREVAPWLTLAALIAVISWVFAYARRPAPPRGAQHPGAPAPARSPR